MGNGCLTLTLLFSIFQLYHGGHHYCLDELEIFGENHIWSQPRWSERKKRHLKWRNQLNIACIRICVCYFFIIEIVNGQIAEFSNKNIQEEMHGYVQIKYIQNTRSNLLCASKCSKLPLCNMYMFNRSNHACSIYTFNLTGSSSMCTGNVACYLRSL